MGDRDHELLAISPVDGRYANRAGTLADNLSEYGLIRTRVEVMAGWVGMLGSGVLPDRDPLSDNAQDHLKDIVMRFDRADATAVKDIESKTNHDVKAVEVWLTGRLGSSDYDDYRSLVHFGCTSEDVNSAAYALMLKRVRERDVQPLLATLDDDLADKAVVWADLSMLALTHGQPATPTTLGKEMRVYAERLGLQIQDLENVEIFAKFSGATGGYNAATFAYPEVEWPQISKRFIKHELDLEFAPYTTQIEPHDWMARYLNAVTQANTILADLAKDMWLYVQRGVLKQKLKAGEVGSSTMPHKVNPIDFENAEGNFDVASGSLQALARSLPISRMQRDLSDSTRLRAIGPALAHSVVGYKSLQRGLGKISPAESRLAEELEENWAVLTEAVQTIMRRYNILDAYDRIKAASRGQELDRDAYLTLVTSLAELPEEARVRLETLTPSTYLGLQVELALGEADGTIYTSARG